MFPARLSVSRLFLATAACLMLSSAFASPLHRLLARNRASRSSNASTLSVHAINLFATVERVAHLTSELRRDFMVNRFGTLEMTVSSGEVTAPSLNLPVAPTANGRNLSDREIVERHYRNLIVFKQVLTEVKGTETGDFQTRIDEIVTKLDDLIDRLQEMRLLHDQTAENFQPSPLAAFDQSVAATVRDKRTLYVLQEFDLYLSPVRSDYSVLSARHQ